MEPLWRKDQQDDEQARYEQDYDLWQQAQQKTNDFGQRALLTRAEMDAFFIEYLNRLENQRNNSTTIDDLPY